MYVSLRSKVKKLTALNMSYSTVMNEQTTISNIYYIFKQHDCNTTVCENKSFTEKQFFNWLSRFCQRLSLLLFWDGAIQRSIFRKHVSPLILFSPPGTSLSVCFCSSHHFCLSPLCCICEIQTLNTNIWKWKHSGSTGLGRKIYIFEGFTAGFRS